MTRSPIVHPWRWLGIIVLLLLVFPTSAVAQGDEGGGDCGDSSTPNLVITAVNALNGGPLLTLAVHTDKSGTPKGNLLFAVRTQGKAYVIQSYDIHKVFIKGHEGGEIAAVDAIEATGAGIRGLGVVNGKQVRLQIDLMDYGKTQSNVDQIRARWRDYNPNEKGMGESGNCSDAGWTNNVWVPVQQINIHQR